MLQAPPEFYLWPEHVDAFNLFCDLGTQWRTGVDGITGLDYTAVVAHMRMVGVMNKNMRPRYAEIREMETGALVAKAEMKAEREKAQ